jgi:hypothetical protein
MQDADVGSGSTAPKVDLSPAMSSTLQAEYARIKLSTRTLNDLATEATAKRATVEKMLRDIEQGKQEILDNQRVVAKSWLDRQLLTNLVSEAEELVQKVQGAAEDDEKEWVEATAEMRKGYAKKRWGGLQQRQHEKEKLGGMIEGVAVSDEGGNQGLVFILKAPANKDASEDEGSNGRSWTWADHEAAKLQLAKRRQAEAAEAEVRRLQELLQSDHTKLDEGAHRLERETSRLREEKLAELARMEERTTAAQQKRRDQAAEAVRRRCASLALAPLPLIFSYKSEKSLCGTGVRWLPRTPLSRRSRRLSASKRRQS